MKRQTVFRLGAIVTMLCVAVKMADTWLNLQRLELEVCPDNEPAMRLYQNPSI